MFTILLGIFGILCYNFVFRLTLLSCDTLKLDDVERILLLGLEFVLLVIESDFLFHLPFIITLVCIVATYFIQKYLGSKFDALVKPIFDDLNK